MSITDPYRWLETDGDPRFAAWADAQDAHASAVLARLPRREELRGRLVERLQVATSVAPHVSGPRLFTLERWSHLDQAVLVVRSAENSGRARTIVDPHRATGDPTAAIDWFHPSPDGRLVAYGISTGGDERSTLHVLDVTTGELLADRIPHTRAASVAWEPDGGGFVYTRYPHGDERQAADRGEGRYAFHHRLGRPWPNDTLVWDSLPDPTAWTTVSLSRDGRWLLVHLSVGWSRTDVHLVDRSTGSRTVLIEGIDARTALEVVDDQVIGITTLGADRGRVVSAPLATAWHDHWCTIVPESEEVVESVAVTSRSLLVLSSRSAVARLWRCDHDGSDRAPVELPGLGSVTGLSGSPDRDEGFVSFTSFATPSTTYRWAPSPPGASASPALTDWSTLDEAPSSDVVVEQVRYPSPDGTEVSMFLVRASTTELGPETPCVLTGYGGFSISMAPSYSAAIAEVCADGGLYAVANVRGGAEEGEAWHRAGMRENKQNTFDDFIAAADWLVATGRTSRARLALRGGSNGGLLVGAAITQRPDLCQVAHIAVPLLDMVRYADLLLGRLWVPEYGDPDDAEQMGWLLGYSPYHRVVEDTCYPAVLLTAATGDSRVHPAHARKMAARLQHATSCGERRPIILREEADAGHGQGKPVSAQAAELADVLGFLLGQIDPPGGDDDHAG